MKTHEFDPLSLIFGVLFLLVGIPLLVSESGLDIVDGSWFFPAFLVVAGVIVLATARVSGAKEDEDDSPDPLIYGDPS